ncbi:MAG: type II toxin-antitoxin system VapC family toxin [Anaerolineales bacterium]|nr:type II toxin-antitoxin system VapC family toxin [Anaerolineales bacterium]
MYLDASALVKRYLQEPGSDAVAALLAEAHLVGTSLISWAEVVAAFEKAARVGLVTKAEALRAVKMFRTDWPALFRLRLDESTVAQADTLAWTHGLRSFDAIHLATAQLWQEALGEAMTFATYDRPLWQATQHIGLNAWPPRPA